jgi:hypothetical protein
MWAWSKQVNPVDFETPPVVAYSNGWRRSDSKGGQKMATEEEFRPVSREMAETLWEGLLLDFTGDDLLSSKLSIRLQKILEELLGGVSQMPMKRNAATQDLTDAMCAWVMQWAASGGVVPTKCREVTFSYVDPFAADKAAAA